MQQSQADRWKAWRAFVSLNWYDGLISFLFRFVAKTSEPLLAAGVILSAADFLQKGQLMAHNPTLADAWAWTQALAIEASTGPVLVFALQAFRSKDQVKGWLYTALAALLFVVGAAMLLLQMVSSVTGFSEAGMPLALLYTLFVLRVLVSGGYVALSCTKHLRFSSQGSETPDVPPPPPAAISDETVQLILSKLAKLDRMEQALAERQVVISESSETPLALPEPTNETDETEPNEPALEAQIAALLAVKADLPSREIATIVGRPHTTVYRTLNRVKQAKQLETAKE